MLETVVSGHKYFEYGVRDENQVCSGVTVNRVE